MKPVAGRALIPVVGGLLVLAAVLLRRSVFVVAVRGSSMSPTYADGDRILAVRTRRVRVGDVVAFTLPPGAASFVTDPSAPAVKRVVAVSNGSVEVHGDAGRSVDSTVFGPVPLDLVIGRAIRRTTTIGG